MKSNPLLLLLILFFYDSAVQAAPQAEKPGQLSPETEMAIMRVMNLENRIQTLQTVPVKMTDNELAGHFSGTWICFTTMRLNGQLGRGIMEIRLEQDGDELVGEGGQLKHPFDPPATIRPIGTRSAAVSDFIGQFKKASKGRHNMVVIERQRVDGPTWATFTAVMAGDGRTARGTLVNAGGNYGLMFMVRREFLSDFNHLLTEEGRRAEASADGSALRTSSSLWTQRSWMRPESGGGERTGTKTASCSIPNFHTRTGSEPIATTTMSSTGPRKYRIAFSRSWLRRETF